MSTSYVAFVGLVLLGRFYAAAFEWAVHRFLLHGMGKKRGSLFGYHYQEHHRACRKNGMLDASYTHGSLFAWSTRARETWSVVAGVVLHVPLMWVSPAFCMGILYGGARYLYVHDRCHRDPEWCRQHAPWHYAHHMAPNQDVNWGVSNQWFDQLVGTRVPWDSKGSFQGKQRANRLVRWAREHLGGALR